MEEKKTLPAFNPMVRKTVVKEVKRLLNKVQDTRTKRGKIEVSRELFYYLLQYRDFVYYHVKFYRTIIGKLLEFIADGEFPDFTQECTEMLRIFVSENTSPRETLGVEMLSRIEGILDPQQR